MRMDAPCIGLESYKIEDKGWKWKEEEEKEGSFVSFLNLKNDNIKDMMVGGENKHVTAIQTFFCHMFTLA